MKEYTTKPFECFDKDLNVKELVMNVRGLLKRYNFVYDLNALTSKFVFPLDKDISDLVPILDIDKQIEMKDVDSEIVKELDVLEPFGEANRKPVFVYKNLKIDSIRALSDGKHLKLTLKDGNILINAIGFNMGALSKEYTIGDKVDIAGMLEINSFNGRDFVQINMRDIMKSL